MERVIAHGRSGQNAKFTVADGGIRDLKIHGGEHTEWIDYARLETCYMIRFYLNLFYHYD